MREGKGKEQGLEKYGEARSGIDCDVRWSS